MNEYEEVLKIAEELREYAELHTDSLSETNQALCLLSGYPDYLSDELYNVLIKEMRDQLENYTENAKIVEIEDTITRTFTELKWRGEDPECWNCGNLPHECICDTL